MVAASAIATTHEVGISLPEGLQPFPHLELDGYALGWLVGRYRGMPLLWHSGGIDGFATQTFVLPGPGIGVTVSANLHSSLLSLAAGLQLLDLAAGTTGEQSWYDTLHPAAAAAPADSRSASVPGRPPADLVGTYVNDGYGDLVLAADGARLVAALGEAELTARFLEGESWELRLEALDAPYRFTFEAESGGQVGTAVATLDPSSGPTTFTRRPS